MSTGARLLWHCTRNIADGTRIVIGTCETGIRHWRVCQWTQIGITDTSSTSTRQACGRLNEILIVTGHVWDSLLHQLHILVRVNLGLVVRHSRRLNILTNHWNIWNDSSATLGRWICHFCIGQTQWWRTHVARGNGTCHGATWCTCRWGAVRKVKLITEDNDK